MAKDLKGVGTWTPFSEHPPCQGPPAETLPANTGMPINNLPPELLAEIISLTLPEPVRGDAIQLHRDNIDRIAPRNFLAVCQHWRSIVLTTQRLWTRLALQLDHASDNDAPNAARLLQQHLDRSGELPLSIFFRSINNIYHMSRRFQVEINRTLFPSQRRWEDVQMETTGLGFSVDVSQLTVSPLRELRLRYLFSSPVGIGEGSLLINLVVLSLFSCSPPFLKILPLAPNLESLTVRLCDVEEMLPLLRYERLRSINVDDRNLLGQLTCPAVQHFICISAIAEIQEFMERSNPHLLSLRLTTPHSTASDLLPTLRSQTSLRLLHLETRFDVPFFHGLSSHELQSDEFRLCPKLQDVTLIGYASVGDGSSLVQFVETRWCTPIRTIKSIKLDLHDTGGTDLGTAMESHEVVAKCIGEGLDFKATGAR